MNESAKKQIELVIRTLNQIPVAGKVNLDMLLGCILTLEDTLKDKEAAAE